MEDISLLQTNSIQKRITEEEWKSLPQEIKEQFLEYTTTVPLISNLISPSRRRAKDLPKDSDGKIIVDLENPHILEDMDYFRPSALHYIEHGCFTLLRPNANPNSEYGKWIREEIRRCYEGYVRPSDGEWVTGDYYFFLNYCPISLAKPSEKDPSVTVRVVSHPNVWEGHYLRTHYLNKARREGKHALELASRGKGKSYLGAALLAKRFVLGESEEVNRKVNCVVTAYEKKYLTGANQILVMFQGYIDFLANSTQFPSRRISNTLTDMNWVMGYVDVLTGTRKGTENAVTGITSKDDESKLRGTRGVLYIVEESGTFPRLIKLFNVLRPSVEDGGKSFGIIYAYGCCCKGTVLHMPNGRPVLIEDIKKGATILGYDGNSHTVEEVTWKQPTGKKECLHIETEKGGSIRCSIDHPLLHYVKGRNKYATFTRASEFKIGDTLLIPRKVGKFGGINEPNALLLGSLLGDGSYSGNQCVTLSVCCKEEYDYFTSKYDCGSSKNIREDGLFYSQLYFRKMHPLLKKYRMDKQSGESKTFPYNIWDWDKESLSAFISGYVNADGNVQIVKGKYRSIKITSKYKHLLDTTQLLLKKYGISSHIYKEPKKDRTLNSKVNKRKYVVKGQICYVLYISNSEDIILFRDNFKLLNSKKQERLDSYTPIKNSRLKGNLVFRVSSNGKGKKLEGNIFNDLQPVTIKKITNIGIQTIYNLTANTTNTYISNGFLSSNTAGDSDSDFHAMQEMMYNADGYNILSSNNVYDKHNSGKSRFAFFFPAYLNANGFYDHNGNSDVVGALLHILKDRHKVKYGSSDPSTIIKRTAEYPIVPQEAIINVSNTLFPTIDLTQRLAEIDTDPSFYDSVYTGVLNLTSSGKVEFKPTSELPIRHFPHKDNKLEGTIEIYEMPEYDTSGKPIAGRYILSSDPYENDQADTLSLGSVFVLDLWNDRIVAEYTGRPTFVDDFHEICRRMCIFYNGRLNYENNKKGTFAYFQRMNCLYLLTDTLEFLKDKQMIKAPTFGNTAKGTPASSIINSYARERIRTWLLTPVSTIKKVDGQDVEVTVPNLSFIKGRALIQELISYNPLGNFDRVSSLGMLMLYREDILAHNGGSLRREMDNPKDYLGNDPFFNVSNKVDKIGY